MGKMHTNLVTLECNDHRTLVKIAKQYLEVGYHIREQRLIDATFFMDLAQDVKHLKSLGIIFGRHSYAHGYQRYCFIGADLYLCGKDLEPIAQVNDKYVYLFED